MNKRFQDSFTSRVQLEYASLLLAGGLAPNISASVDLQAESSSNTPSASSRWWAGAQ